MKFDNKKTIIIVSILFLVIVLLVSLVINNNIITEGLEQNVGQVTTPKDKTFDCLGNIDKWETNPFWNKDPNLNKFPKDMQGYVSKKDANWFLTDVSRYDPTKHRKEDYLWHCQGPKGSYGRLPNQFYSHDDPKDKKKKLCPYGLVDFNGACYNPPSKAVDYPTLCSGYDDNQKSFYYGWRDSNNNFYSCKADDGYKSYKPLNGKCPGNLKNIKDFCKA
jgi:hypothetical protein